MEMNFIQYFLAPDLNISGKIKLNSLEENREVFVSQRRHFMAHGPIISRVMAQFYAACQKRSIIGQNPTNARPG